MRPTEFRGYYEGVASAHDLNFIGVIIVCPTEDQLRRVLAAGIKPVEFDPKKFHGVAVKVAPHLFPAPADQC